MASGNWRRVGPVRARCRRAERGAARGEAREAGARPQAGGPEARGAGPSPLTFWGRGVVRQLDGVRRLANRLEPGAATCATGWSSTCRSGPHGDGPRERVESTRSASGSSDAPRAVADDGEGLCRPRSTPWSSCWRAVRTRASCPRVPARERGCPGAGGDHLRCTCPDGYGAGGCASTSRPPSTGVGVRLDEDPELLFRLRQVRTPSCSRAPPPAWPAAARRRAAPAAPIADDRVAAVFGIRLEAARVPPRAGGCAPGPGDARPPLVR